LVGQTSAQVAVPYFGTQTLINGYARSIQGENIPYFSVYPKYARVALLTRCTDGKKTIQWETDPIPESTNGGYAYFTWIAAHSTGTNSGDRNFDLYVNDQYALTFTTHKNSYPPYWTFGGNDSTRLVFEFKTKDGASDAHGMAYLRVPLSKYGKGRSLRLKIVGQNQQSNDWFMTFQYSFKERLDLAALPFLLKEGVKNRQLVKMTVLHFGKTANLELLLNGKDRRSFTIENGFNVFEIGVAPVKKNSNLKVEASMSQWLHTTVNLLLKPVVYREIDLVHHSHTDIGYSHIQEDVIKIHNQNIRRALHLIEKTKDYPEGSRFIWNIESSWAVENFLAVATEEERKQFFTAVRNKQIAVAATYANVLTGLCTPEEMEWITEYSRSLRDKENIPVMTGMMTDIPGMNWSMVKALASNGIRYFSNGPNYVESIPGHGDRIGHILEANGNKAFWWVSPSGKDSILYWTCGKGYSSWHGVPEGGVKDRGADKIADYLDELDSTGYPYSIVQWRYNIVSDNGPTDSTISDYVRDWNEKYASPKLVLANVNELFERFEKQYGKKLKAYNGDLTPYWEDGAYSTAKEEGDNRLLSERITDLENYARQNKKQIDPQLLYRARRGVVMFHEHTWGSWNSISDPDNKFTTHQWEYKKGFLDSAKYYVNKIERQLFPVVTKPGYVVVTNTLNWNRNGFVTIEWPDSVDFNSIFDEMGNRIPMQRDIKGRMCFMAISVPANGKRTYQLRKIDNIVCGPFESVVEYEIDSSTGAIRHMIARKKEWVDTSRYKGLLQALYVKGNDPGHFSLSRFSKVDFTEEASVFRTQKIDGTLEGCNSVSYEITEFSHANYIRLSVIIDKKAIRDKESIHIAFPFAVTDALVKIGIGDSYISPPAGQLAGANKDFFSVQRWLDLSDKDNGVTITSPQGALFEMGEMVNEVKNANGYKVWKEESVSSSTLFLYALNNYWHTNYKADQSGTIRFDVYIQFHGAFDPVKAQRFGYEVTQPLIAEYSK